MADEGRRGGAEDAQERGPGHAYMQFVLMEDLLDKLKLINYEQEFLKGLGFKPLSRHYFAVPTNPGEQFYIFTTLSAWLINLAGKQFDTPQEYDDPNATISNILDEVRQLGAAVDFPPGKLKPGCGEHCIYVLDKLADEALRQTKFKWGKPKYPEEEMDEETNVDDDVELKLDKVEDEFALSTWLFYLESLLHPVKDVSIVFHRDVDFKSFTEEEEADDDLDEEESFLDLEGLRNLQSKKDAVEGSRPEEIMESTVDANEWKLEVERVTPSLKVHIRTDNKDWRTHVDQMHQHRDGINTALSETKGHLSKLHQEISRTLEKIASREKYINNQLEHLLQEFRGMQDSLAEAKEQYRQASGGVTERTRNLAEITEDLEKIKQEMEERGSSMTDGSPLVKIKQALQRLKNEVTQMDVRLGVVEQSLLQAKLKDKSIMQKDMNKPLSSTFEA